MINHLFLYPQGGWPNFPVTGQPIVWREVPPLPTWVLFGAVLGLLALALWLVRACTRLNVGTTHFSYQRERHAAEQRAEVLLRQHVSTSQYQQLQTDGYLEVASQLHPGRTYRIPARTGRVMVYEAEQPIAQLCVIARDPMPQADLILAQKWLIEADEQAYLALANWFDCSSPYRAMRRLDSRLELLC